MIVELTVSVRSMLALSLMVSVNIVSGLVVIVSSKLSGCPTISNPILDSGVRVLAMFQCILGLKCVIALSPPKK